MPSGDKPNATGLFIIAAWGGFLGIFAFLLLTHSAMLSPDWCASSDSCLRDWAAALSGWVASVVAGITVFVLVATLKHMQRATEHSRYLGEIQTQAYVHASKATFGEFNNILVYCKNSGLTPATHFSVNGEVKLVTRGNVSASIGFKNDGFKIWSVLGSQEELSVSLDVDADLLKRFRSTKRDPDELLLFCGQIIYCTIDNHDHLTQFAFYVAGDLQRFRRPTANLKSFLRLAANPYPPTTYQDGSNTALKSSGVISRLETTSP